MDTQSPVADLVERYFRSWQQGDLTALRACLADEISFDWGAAVYTDPDQFVAATASGIEWRDVRLLASVYQEDSAVIVYEGVNVTDGLEVRTAEYLECEASKIRASIVVFAVIGRGV